MATSPARRKSAAGRKTRALRLRLWFLLSARNERNQRPVLSKRPRQRPRPRRPDHPHLARYQGISRCHSGRPPSSHCRFAPRRGDGGARSVSVCLEYHSNTLTDARFRADVVDEIPPSQSQISLARRQRRIPGTKSRRLHDVFLRVQHVHVFNWSPDGAPTASGG